MPCTPDSCDLHDYKVAPGSGWCRAVDAAHYFREAEMSRSSSRNNEDLAGAIWRLGDIVERMDRRQSWSPPAIQQKKEQRKGGTPL